MFECKLCVWFMQKLKEAFPPARTGQIVDDDTFGFFWAWDDEADEITVEKISKRDAWLDPLDALDDAMDILEEMINAKAEVGDTDVVIIHLGDDDE